MGASNDCQNFHETTSMVFQPVYQAKVWGGRSLETFYGRALPGDGAYGESWELVDRDDAQSVIVSGRPGAGLSLNDLWTRYREPVFGRRLLDHPSPRFPILVKILDARDDLSIQVHPPAEVAEGLGGEPKTEMWYIARAEPGSKLYVGLRAGVSRDDFESGISDGQTRDQVHALEPKAGESIFIPSGRLHAIGGGLLIYEIQQNSDTTYRVYDWDRPGSDGKPRALHVEESLQCIDFDDVEPVMDEPAGDCLVQCEYFEVRRRVLEPGASTPIARTGEGAIVSVVSGKVLSGEDSFSAGDFFLVPAAASTAVRELRAATSDGAEVLVTWFPEEG